MSLRSAFALSNKKGLYRNFRRATRLSRFVKSRLTPAGMFALVATGILAIFGLDTHASNLYQLFSLCAYLLFFSMVYAIFFRAKFQVQRFFPPYATVEQAFTYRIEITNPNKTVYRDLELQDRLRLDLPSWEAFNYAKDPGDKGRNYYDRLVGYPRWQWLIKQQEKARPEKFPVLDLPAKASVDIFAKLTPKKRGIYHFDGVSLIRQDPLGLINSFVLAPCENKLLVLPKRFPVPNLTLSGKKQFHTGGENYALSVGESEEFNSLREFRPGDALKHINWRVSARQGKPIVKEFQEEHFVRHALIFDTFHPDHQETLFEGAVSLTASFAQNLNQEDSLLDLLFVANKAYRVSAGRGIGQIRQLLEVLACVQPASTDKFDELQVLIHQRIHLMSNCVLILLSLDEKRRALIKQLIAQRLNLQIYYLVKNSDSLSNAKAQLSDLPLSDACRVDILRSSHLEQDLLHG